VHLEYKKVTSFSIFILILSTSTLIRSEVFQWKDAQGQVHFGDRPPNSTKAENISDKLDKINLSTDLSSPELILKYERQKEAKRQNKREQKSQESKLNSIRSKLCTRALENQQILVGRVIFMDENGKEMKVTEKERQKRADEIAVVIKKNCK